MFLIVIYLRSRDDVFSSAGPVLLSGEIYMIKGLRSFWFHQMCGEYET